MIKFTEEVTTTSLIGNFLKYMDRLMKNDLIILDAFALRAIDEQTRIDSINYWMVVRRTTDSPL